MASQKRKLWTDESMEAAYQAVLDGKGLRETSRLYNVPVETLRRRVNGSIGLGCKPGLATILNDEQEDLLCKYIIKIADMGYGLTKEDVQHLAFSIVEKIGCKHPFIDGKAGHGWFDGFKSRHPQLTFYTPQSLSQKKLRGKNALNSKSVCITDPEILKELKAKEAEKADEAEKKRVRIAERAKKATKREEKRKS